MNRWLLVVVLLFSLGINVGILATLAANRVAGHPQNALPEPFPPRVMPEGDPLPPQRPQGEPSDARPQRPPMPHLDRMADHLGLTGDDRERFLEIQRTFFLEVQEQRRNLNEARRGLRWELTAEEPDRSRAEELMQRSATAHSALERALVTNVLESREILGPEQERQFAILIERIAQGPGNQGGPLEAGAFRRRDRPGVDSPDDFQGRPPNRDQDRRNRPRRRLP